VDSHEVRRQWADRTGEYSPAYYAHYGPNETSEAVLELLDQFVDDDARVLELGCSSGRHLAHLFHNGYANLTGIEVNGDAFDVMADTYPDLAAAGTFHHDTIENMVSGFDDDAFDAVFSVETLQHIHPDAEWVFDDLARITSAVLVTAEVESPVGSAPDDPTGEDSTGEGSQTDQRDVNFVDEEMPLYYRDWNDVFTARGLEEVDRRIEDRDTVRAFQPSELQSGD
jgi:SAM-dependent methyltransferase